MPGCLSSADCTCPVCVSSAVCICHMPCLCIFSGLHMPCLCIFSGLHALVHGPQDIACTAVNEIKHAVRVLSRYRDARRTRILRIRLRLTVRVNKPRKDFISFRGLLSLIFHLHLWHRMIPSIYQIFIESPIRFFSRSTLMTLTSTTSPTETTSSGCFTNL